MVPQMDDKSRLGSFFVILVSLSWCLICDDLSIGKKFTKIRNRGPGFSKRQSFRRHGGMRGASGELKGLLELEIWK